MPTLPTLTVTDDQANRMLAAYSPHPGATNVETQAAYREWLRIQIVNYVIAFEVKQVQQSITEAERAKKAEVVAALPKPPVAVAPVEAALPAP